MDEEHLSTGGNLRKRNYCVTGGLADINKIRKSLLRLALLRIVIWRDVQQRKYPTTLELRVTHFLVDVGVFATILRFFLLRFCFITYVST